ncbi:NAD-dependent epimerase/dehydratase family protein [Rhodococcus erythropolis]|uniref:NAD-dependent epimerase/dehydratase family protein n=1 Tax=Rhodococcus erythropolis TaxID=1833 RepID=UPI0008A3ECB2|nr:NAD-dependent epimerase/dehydratase family protein [Rhodococcus erythropolis]MBT1254072.1 NAD-dependent epimerase/dehydratase family protein [Rhodococcus erythropolis]OHF28985.1 oxidoreductase [Rhodococcus erythropolis]
MTTLVLGATGFIGSAVMNQLVSRDGNAAIGFVRTDSAAKQLSRNGIAAIIGDINESASLRVAMSQASTVICCVSYVGDDEQQCVHVNEHGIRNVASFAAAVGVERLLYVSTAAVYGPGPFRDLPVNGAPLKPLSPASRTRALAEEFVRDAGGLVVRPHLVYGPGDRWFLPTLTRIVSRLDSIIDNGSAILSVVDVNLLARSIYKLSTEQQFRYGSTLHVNEPVPRAVIDLLEHHAQETNWTLPQSSIPRADAVKAAAQLGLDMHKIDMISLDHWFRSRLY